MADKKRNADKRAGQRPRKPGQEDQATADEFEREGMGVAAKE